MESKRLESRKTLRSGADKLAGTMISNFKNTLELTQRRELEELKRRESQPIVVEPYLCKFELDRWDQVIFTFKADLRNVSQSTFIDAEFYEEYIAGEDWVGEPYIRDRLAAWVSFYFNKEYVLRRDEGMFSNLENLLSLSENVRLNISPLTPGQFSSSILNGNISSLLSSLTSISIVGSLK